MEQFNNHKSGNFCIIPQEFIGKIDTLLELIENELNTEDTILQKQSCLAALLSIFLINVQRHGLWEDDKRNPKKSISYKYYTDFLELLEDNFYRHHAVDWYAKNCVSQPAL